MTFLLGQTLVWRGARARGRRLTGLAWVLFAAFWVAMLPVFLFEMRSVIETVLAVVAVPICLLAARALWRGHDGVALLSRALGVTGVLYATALVVPGVREFLVESVATHTEAVMRTLGYEFLRQESQVNGFESEFVFVDGGGHRYVTYIVLACTGIGALASFTGVIAAVSAPLGRKLRTAAAVIATIWVLNVARNVFIAVAFGKQWFQAAPLVELASVAGYDDPAMASFFVADRVLSQSLSVLAIVVVAVLVLRLLPESATLFEAALYLLTGREYVLSPDLRLRRADRADDSIGSD